MSWLVVTPVRNERTRLAGAARSLAAQAPGTVGLWVVVDDGSTDGTADVIPPDLPFPVLLLRRDNSGGLSGGSAFGAFLHGAGEGLRRHPDASRVMKFDADARLAPDYIATIDAVEPAAALVTGRIEEPGNPMRGDYTRGVLKAYDRQAFEIVRRMPVALGWDVMDEIALRQAGLPVALVRAASAHVTRSTGSSEGLLAGRRRAGIVSRWTGYHQLYFLLRLCRYALRRPFLLGAAATAWGWLTAGTGPYPLELRRAKRAEQTRAMRAALRRARSVRPARKARASLPRSTASRTPSDPDGPLAAERPATDAVSPR